MTLISDLVCAEGSKQALRWHERNFDMHFLQFACTRHVKCNSVVCVNRVVFPKSLETFAMLSVSLIY